MDNHKKDAWLEHWNQMPLRSPALVATREGVVYPHNLPTRGNPYLLKMLVETPWGDLQPCDIRPWQWRPIFLTFRPWYTVTATQPLLLLYLQSLPIGTTSCILSNTALFAFWMWYPQTLFGSMHPMPLWPYWGGGGADLTTFCGSAAIVLHPTPLTYSYLGKYIGWLE